MKTTSDGSTASYYELPKGCTELQDLISYRNLNAQDGEIFRAIYRKGLASHSDALRDAKKVLFYATAEVKRLEALRAVKDYLTTEPSPAFAERIKAFDAKASAETDKVIAEALIPYRKAADDFLETIPRDDGWIKWDGGECPVKEGLLVDIEDRSGEQWIAQCPVKECDWRRADDGRRLNSDIIAYRIHKAGE